MILYVFVISIFAKKEKIRCEI